jgi:hypothetical protein
MRRPVVVSPVKAKAVDDVDDAGRQDVGDQLHEDEDRERCLLGGFEDDGVAGGKRGSELPGSHQQREVPGDDEADDTERFVVMIGNRGCINFGDAAFLRADDAGEVAEVVDGQRQVGSHGFADGLAVVPGFDGREQFEIVLHALGNLLQHLAALGNGGFAPGGFCGVGGVERAVDIGGVRAWDLAEDLAGDRGDVVKVFAGGRGYPLATDVVLILFADFDREAVGSGTQGGNCRHRSCSFGETDLPASRLETAGRWFFLRSGF